MGCIVAAMSGVANPLVTADRFDTPASHEAMQAIGSGLGAAGFIVFDDATDFAEVAYGVSRFLAVESCGQCTPCREGTGWMWRVLERMAKGQAEKREIDMLLNVSYQVEGHTICALGDAAACQERVAHAISPASGIGFVRH